MLCADFRLPKPKALRREFIEFIRGGGRVGPGGKSKGRTRGKGEGRYEGGVGGQASEGRCAYWAGRDVGRGRMRGVALCQERGEGSENIGSRTRFCEGAGSLTGWKRRTGERAVGLGLTTFLRIWFLGKGGLRLPSRKRGRRTKPVEEGAGSRPEENGWVAREEGTSMESNWIASSNGWEGG